MTPIDIPISSAAPFCEWGVEAPWPLCLSPFAFLRSLIPKSSSSARDGLPPQWRVSIGWSRPSALSCCPRNSTSDPDYFHLQPCDRTTTPATSNGPRQKQHAVPEAAHLVACPRAEQVCKAKSSPGRKPVLRATHLDGGGPRHNLEPMGSRWDLSGNLDVGLGGQSTRAPLMTPGPAKGLLVWVATWMYQEACPGWQLLISGEAPAATLCR